MSKYPALFTALSYQTILSPDGISERLRIVYVSEYSIEEQVALVSHAINCHHFDLAFRERSTLYSFCQNY